jgi:hypothetical protein
MILLSQLALLAVVASDPTDVCRVQVFPDDAPPGWSAAAADLQRQLRAGPAGDHDCRDVVVHALTRASFVEVTTSDGRRAVRALADAADLQPTVAALIVTIPADLEVTPAQEVTLTAAPAGADRRWKPLLYAGGGARLTLPSTPAPLVEIMAGAIRGRWELALFAGWAPHVQGTGATLPGGASTGEIGVAAARRQPVRFGALIAGGRVGAIRLGAVTSAAGADGPDTTQTTQTTQSGNNQQEDVIAATVAPAVAAFVGSAVRVGSRLRLRPQLAVQWLPPLRAGGPNAPSVWSLGLTLGAESGVP